MTKDYDGSLPADRGMHARLESSVDHRVNEIAALDRDRVHAEDVVVVWPSVIAEMKQAHALIPEVMANDRAVRSIAEQGRTAYTDALMARELPMIARQVGDAANVLGSIWLFEWRQAASPFACLSDRSTPH